jgi:hypothetical protein
LNGERAAQIRCSPSTRSPSAHSSWIVSVPGTAPPMGQVEGEADGGGVLGSGGQAGVADRGEVREAGDR